MLADKESHIHNDLIYYCLCHLDGILEDRRSRVKYYIEIMNHFKEKKDLVGILLTFIQSSQHLSHRDIASHILVLLIDGEKHHDKVRDHAKHFLNIITTQKEMGFASIDRNPLISLHALSFAIMTLVKTNQLAQEFCNALGFKILNDFLDGPCLSNAQIAYQVVSTLWVMSYHDFSHSFFEDYSQAIIEKVSKILDYFSWEKIVRIMLMLYDNLKSNAICQEHLSDIDCLTLIIKL